MLCWGIWWGRNKWVHEGKDFMAAKVVAMSPRLLNDRDSLEGLLKEFFWGEGGWGGGGIGLQL